MKTQWPPKSEIVLRDFNPICSFLWDALDFGCERANLHFEEHGIVENFDPWLHSHLARFHASRKLKLSNLNELGFEIQFLPFSGLWLRSPTLDVRVLKVDRRADPATGLPSRRIQAQNVSQTRKDYYCQPSMEFENDLLSLDGIFALPRVKLVVLWETNGAYQLSNMELACPKWLNTTRRLVETHWWIPLDRNSTVVSPSDAIQGPPITLDDVDFHVSEDDDTATGSHDLR